MEKSEFPVSPELTENCHWLKREQIEEKEDLGIPSAILSTKDDMLLPISQVCFWKTVEDFLDAKFQNVLKNKDSLLKQLCHAHCS